MVSIPLRGLGLFRRKNAAASAPRFETVSIPLRGLGLFRQVNFTGVNDDDTVFVSIPLRGLGLFRPHNLNAINSASKFQSPCGD